MTEDRYRQGPSKAVFSARFRWARADDAEKIMKNDRGEAPTSAMDTDEFPMIGIKYIDFLNGTVGALYKGQ